MIKRMKVSFIENILPIPIDGGGPSNECSGCVKQAYLNRSRASLHKDRGCQLKSSCMSGEVFTSRVFEARTTNWVCQVRRRVFSFIHHLLAAVDVITCTTQP